jgi:hypothetical protein
MPRESESESYLPVYVRVTLCFICVSTEFVYDVNFYAQISKNSMTLYLFYLYVVNTHINQLENKNKYRI